MSRAAKLEGYYWWSFVQPLDFLAKGGMIVLGGWVNFSFKCHRVVGFVSTHRGVLVPAAKDIAFFSFPMYQRSGHTCLRC